MVERRYRCNTCGDKEWPTSSAASKHHSRFPDHEIEVLECANPQCEDKGWSSTRRHTLRISLRELIEFYVSGGS
jgi:hypothetical protein